MKSGLLPQNDFQELLHGIEKDEIEADRCIGLVQAEGEHTDILNATFID